MKNIIAALAVIAATSGANAQTMTNNAESQSYSQSGVLQEGDSVNSRSFSSMAPSTNSTAPCIKAVTGGIAIFSGGAGVTAHGCEMREEADVLRKIAAMPPSPEKTVVIYHLCRNDKTMRETMIAMGWCSVAR